MLLNKEVMDLIGDYDIIVDDPKKHIPWAMFAMTADAYLFMQKLKKERPEIDWKMMKLEDWQKEYHGQRI